MTNSARDDRAPEVGRRTFLATTGGTLAAAVLGCQGPPVGAGEAPRGAESSGAGYRLPALPYPYDGLEPAIDKATLQFHHDKHFAAYVANYNKALEGQPDLLAKPLPEVLRDLGAVPEALRTAVRNQGGGVYNHELYFASLKPGGGGEPKGELAAAIAAAFGSFGTLRTALGDASTKVFGSGWGWLVKKGGKLEVTTSPNQDSPISQGAVPLLPLDVWEHAYYLKYQNRRADYVQAFWSVVNWDEVARRFREG
jgi:superoxide dismutase, Fe-Mn family